MIERQVIGIVRLMVGYIERMQYERQWRKGREKIEYHNEANMVAEPGCQSAATGFGMGGRLVGGAGVKKKEAEEEEGADGQVDG